MENKSDSMEFEFTKNQIKFDKILNSLDKFTIDFCKVLDKKKIKYVLISGYVAILFGRSRASEDIDIFIEKLEYDKFLELWKALDEKFECLNTTKPKEAYNEYLLNKTSIRFSKKGLFIPNMEVKFAQKPTDLEAINKKIKVIVNKNVIYTSPLESQIAFKLYLGSEKDIEDARHLYKVFKNYLDEKKLLAEISKLKIKEEVFKYLK